VAIAVCLFFVVTVILAIVVAKEQPGPLGYPGIGLAIAAVVLLALDQRAG
jgi:drug/metabolite transporter (DMT)-like permease